MCDVTGASLSPASTNAEACRDTTDEGLHNEGEARYARGRVWSRVVFVVM